MQISDWIYRQLLLKLNQIWPWSDLIFVPPIEMISTIYFTFFVFYFMFTPNQAHLNPTGPPPNTIFMILISLSMDVILNTIILKLQFFSSELSKHYMFWFMEQKHFFSNYIINTQLLKKKYMPIETYLCWTIYTAVHRVNQDKKINTKLVTYYHGILVLAICIDR